MKASELEVGHVIVDAGGRRKVTTLVPWAGAVRVWFDGGRSYCVVEDDYEFTVEGARPVGSHLAEQHGVTVRQQSEEEERSLHEAIHVLAINPTHDHGTLP